MMFAAVVGQVFGSWGPSDFDLFVCVDTIFEPVEAHVNCLGTTLFHSTIDDATSCFVICTDDCWWLRVTHIN